MYVICKYFMYETAIENDLFSFSQNWLRVSLNGAIFGIQHMPAMIRDCSAWVFPYPRYMSGMVSTLCHGVP